MLPSFFIPLSILFDMLAKLLGENLFETITKVLPKAKITEIRVRIGRKIVIKDAYKSYTLDYVATKSDLELIIAVATHNSLYAYEDQLRKGFLTFDGLRIGVIGEGVTDVEKLLTIKNITSLVIRIPHQIIGAASQIKSITDDFDNTLIIAPPFGGKTTLIRDVARILSNTKDTLIIDERDEIFSKNYTFGVNIDVFSLAPKQLVTEGIIRACSPEVIVLDELFPDKDLKTLGEIANSGIKVLASIHGYSFEDVKKGYPKLIDLFKYTVVLGNKPKVGSIKSVIRI